MSKSIETLDKVIAFLDGEEPEFFNDAGFTINDLCLVRDELSNLQLIKNFVGNPELDYLMYIDQDTGVKMHIVSDRLYNQLNDKSHVCQCDHEKKIGQTKIWCCNICGKPDSDQEPIWCNVMKDKD